MLEEFHYRPIGIIRSEHTDPAKSPIQPCYAEGSLGTVEIFRNTLRASTILKAIRTSICSITAIEQSPPL